jgi:hypothetical protein
VKLIASVLTADRPLAAEVRARLEERFGPADYISAEMPFGATRYYEREFGPGLVRRLMSFEQLIAPDSLPGIKLLTNDLEDGYLRPDGRRRVNIDPGYIALQHMLLATCKAFGHRPYLGRGVYGDMTLIYRGATFTALDWSFPDYSSGDMISLLNGIRAAYHRQLRQARTPPQGDA